MNISIIVTYNPDKKLFNILDSLSKQKCKVIIIDNSSTNKEYLDSLINTFVDIEIIFLKKNYGIAYAQNIGIEYAKKKFFDYVFLFDQDSEIPNDFIETMKNEWNQLEERNVSIGCIAPNYKKSKKDKGSRFLIIKKNKFKRVNVPQNSRIEVHNVISSGMMISVQLLHQLGNMNESFFIDQVDTEFCMRIFNSPYVIYATDKTFLLHQIGNNKQVTIFGKKLNINNHASIRKYYFVRNSIWILKNNASKNIIFSSYVFLQLCFTIFSSILIEDNKFKKLKSIIKGIRDGLNDKKRN